MRRQHFRIAGWKPNIVLIISELCPGKRRAINFYPFLLINNLIFLSGLNFTAKIKSCNNTSLLSDGFSSDVQKVHKRYGYKTHKKYVVDLVNNHSYVI